MYVQGQSILRERTRGETVNSVELRFIGILAPVGTQFAVDWTSITTYLRFMTVSHVTNPHSTYAAWPAHSPPHSFQSSMFYLCVSFLPSVSILSFRPTSFLSFRGCSFYKWPLSFLKVHPVYSFFFFFWETSWYIFLPKSLGFFCSITFSLTFSLDHLFR